MTQNGDPTNLMAVGKARATASLSIYPAERSSIRVVSVERASLIAQCFQVTGTSAQEGSAPVRTPLYRLIRGISQGKNQLSGMTPEIASMRTLSILIPVMRERRPTGVTPVARDTVAAQASPFITGLTRERNLINVRSAVNALVRVQTFNAIRECTVKKSRTNVKSVVRALVGMLIFVFIRGSTGVRNHINVRSVGRALLRLPIITSIRGSTLGRNLTNVMSVVRASVTTHH